VSLSHPRGAGVLAALGRGVAILRDRGELPRAYRECGFMDPRVAQWVRVGP